jgi:hypothetical protein
MFAKPIHAELKPLFKAIFERGELRGRQTFAELEKRINGADHFERILTLYHEDEKTNKLIAESLHPYYIKNSESDLLNYFASRTYLLSVDESAELEDAIYLSTYDKFLYDAIDPLRETVPQYTFDKFLAGEPCPYYDELPKEYVTDKGNYFAISDWQAAKLQKVVWHDFAYLLEQLQAIAANLADPVSYLLAIKKTVTSLLDDERNDATTLKSALAGCSFLPGNYLKNLDAGRLSDELTYYRKSDLHLKSITPAVMAPALVLIDENHEGLVGNELCLWFSLDQLEGWLEEVENGRSWTGEVSEPDWRALIDGTRTAVEEEIETLTAAMEAVAYDEDRSKKEISDYLIGEFEQYRTSFKAFEHKWLFGLFRDNEESNAHIDRVIITNSFFGRDSEINLRLLHRAMVLHGMIWVTVQIYADVFETHRIEFPDDDTSHFSIMSLLSTMAPDKELYEAMINSLDDAVAYHESYFLPFDLFKQNHREDFHHIFHRAVDRLQGILDDAEPSNKILYLQTRLKELRQRSLKKSQITDDDREFGSYDDRYSNFFKEFLELEADYINQVRGLSFQPPLQLAAKAVTAKILSPPLTFNELLTPDQAALLLSTLESVGITRDGRSVISERRKGALRGVVEALLDAHLLPATSLEQLCRVIAGHIGLELHSKLDYSQVSERFRKTAAAYIKQYHSTR